MKIKDTVCDICGESILHERHYTVKKKWYDNVLWENTRHIKRIDLCRSCWNDFTDWMHEKMMEAEQMNKDYGERRE